MKETMDLNEISIFLEVVESKGFGKAAKKLGMPNSTVSSKISSLEKHLSTTLIQRTTRQLKITQAGLNFYEQCKRGLLEIQNAERQIVASRTEPQGLLRITAPVDLGGKVLPNVISQYLAKFPKVKVELSLTDHITDLVGEKFDVAFRVGKLDDSSLIARKIGFANYALYAAPKYVKNRGLPLQIRDLREHSCLSFQPMGIEEWQLEGKNGTVKVPITGPIVVNSLSALKSFLIQGDGIAYCPKFLVEEELANKKLLRVLPDWSSKPRPFHVIYPAQKHLPPAVSTFVRFAVESLQEMFQ